MSLLSDLRVGSANIDLNVKRLFRDATGIATVPGTGTTQADGAPLTTSTAALTVSDGTVGWVLPPAKKGMRIMATNTVAAQTALVYAAVGEVINAIGTTAAFSQLGGSRAEYICDADAHWYVAAANLTGTSTTSTTAELNYLDLVTLGTGAASKAVVLDTGDDYIWPAAGILTYGVLKDPAGTTLGATAAELNKSDGIVATAYQVVVEELTFTQTTGSGTYTGTIAMPAGSQILDVAVHGIALWDGDTTSSLVVGDGGTANGFFTATDLKATDLLAGEVNNFEHPGGKAGVFIGSEQRVLYDSGARSVIGVLTQVGTGTTGRTRLVVTYANPTAVAATKA